MLTFIALGPLVASVTNGMILENIMACQAKIMSSNTNTQASRRQWLKTIIAFLICFGTALTGQAQTKTLNVADFGARGDAVRFMGSTIANSSVITVQTTNRFSAQDAGKLIQLFGVGSQTTATNYQDMIATVQSVANGTNITISVPPSATSNNVYCVIGTQNAGPFQACVNAAGTNAIINIPDGTYLLVPPSLLTSNYFASSMFAVPSTVVITNSDLRLVGASTNTVLLGNGAWLLKTNFVQRGMIFFLQGPVINKGNMSFENLTFDGGVQKGRTSYSYWPGRTYDGDGWDMSHGAVLDIGPTPIQRSKIFTNCVFTHWRGEILKSVTSNFDYLTTLVNCRFNDGNASALNFTGTYNVTGCSFDTLDMAMEFYMGYSFGDSIFRNNSVTNVRNAFVIVGALTNNTRPTIMLTNNSISASDIGVMMSPARHVNIVDNRFYGMNTGIMPNSTGYQGTDRSGDFSIKNNSFTNVGYTFQEATGVKGLENVLIQSNIVNNCGWFAYGYGWGTNVVFQNNVVAGIGGGLNSTSLKGQLYLDDISNIFPPYSIWDYNKVTGSYTNTVTYRRGMRQSIDVAQTNSVYAFDDAEPLVVPTGAMIVLTSAVNRTVPVYLSNTRSTAPIQMNKGDVLMCQWTNNSWKAVGPIPKPPTALRLAGQ